MLTQLSWSLDVRRKVQIAAFLLLAYGVLVVVNAFIVGHSQGFSISESIFPRPVVRLVGMALLATSLMRGARWAWWVTVILGGFWLVLGVAGLVTLELTDNNALPPSTRVFMPINVLLLGFAIFQLLRTRSAFHS